jgi:hypothetical protein
MARIRSIHPAACTSEKLGALTGDEERCYWRLQTHCDDAGRCEDHPRLLWHALFPTVDGANPEMVDAWLSAIEATGLIVRYETGGKRYLEVADFATFQKPKHPTPSRIPPPVLPPSSPEDSGVSEQAGEDVPGSLHGVGVGVGVGVGEGVEFLAPALPSPDVELHAIDDLAFAVYAACRIDPGVVTRSALGAYRRAISDLRAVDATPEQVKVRSKVYRSRWPSASLTPPALAKQWAACDPGTIKNPGQPETWKSDGMLEPNTGPPQEASA